MQRFSIFYNCFQTPAEILSFFWVDGFFVGKNSDFMYSSKNRLQLQLCSKTRRLLSTDGDILSKKNSYQNSALRVILSGEKWLIASVSMYSSMLQFTTRLQGLISSSLINCLSYDMASIMKVSIYSFSASLPQLCSWTQFFLVLVLWNSTNSKCFPFLFLFLTFVFRGYCSS